MPTTRRTESDACQLLDMDHRKVKKMFKDYETLTASRAANTAEKKRALAMEICSELRVHAQLEEEIFYPAVREAIKNPHLLDEAEVEHGSAKELIMQIESEMESDEMRDAKVAVLGEYVNHHIREERNDIFVKARATRGLDLMAMRETLQARKEELIGEMTGAMA